MKLISHRGNIDEKNESYENEPNYIDKAIKEGYDVEIDVWLIDDVIYLGHDDPRYVVGFRWIRDRISKLWIHCKNIDALHYFNCSTYTELKYFWHQEDDVTLTSNNFLWTYPGKPLTHSSIAVKPEVVNYTNEELKKCYGICSDYIKKYKEI